MQLIADKTFHLVPLSLNNVYPTSRSGHRYLSDAGRLFKNTVKEQFEDIKVQEDIYLRLELIFYMPDLWFKNGKPRKKDLSNFIKLIEDAVYETLGLDDSRTFELSAKKIGVSGKHFVNIKLYKIEPLVLTKPIMG